MTKQSKKAEIKKLSTQLEQLLANTPDDQKAQALAEFIFGKGVQLT